jgi:putative membrane protein
MIKTRYKLSGLVVLYVMLVLMSMQAFAVTQTQNFLQNSAIANQFEISASRVALQKSQNDEVRQFAHQMIDDHTQIGSQEKQVITEENLNVQRPSPSLDPKHQKLLDKLNDASPEDFDKLYVKDQIDGHKEAVSLFSDYAKNGDDQGLKNFASDTLPTIKDHLKLAKDLNKS